MALVRLRIYSAVIPGLLRMKSAAEPGICFVLPHSTSTKEQIPGSAREKRGQPRKNDEARIPRR